MSCSSISLIKHTRSFITPGLISLRKCWGCGFGREGPPLSHSYDHPFRVETINPVFSRCSVPLKRIFNPPLIDCWKLNACQFEWVLQSFKKCSVCKTGRLLLQIVHCHRKQKDTWNIQTTWDWWFRSCMYFLMRWIFFIDILLLHYLWRLIWRCHRAAEI